MYFLKATCKYDKRKASDILVKKLTGKFNLSVEE